MRDLLRSNTHVHMRFSTKDKEGVFGTECLDGEGGVRAGRHGLSQAGGGALPTPSRYGHISLPATEGAPGVQALWSGQTVAPARHRIVDMASRSPEIFTIVWLDPSAPVDVFPGTGTTQGIKRNRFRARHKNVARIVAQLRGNLV